MYDSAGEDIAKKEEEKRKRRDFQRSLKSESTTQLRERLTSGVSIAEEEGSDVWNEYQRRQANDQTISK